MPHRDHSPYWGKPAPPEDEQEWQALVQSRLPADLEEQARLHKAFVRVRTVPTASALLGGLLYSVLSHSSLREVAGWSRLIGLTGQLISGQAWHQRLLKSADWLLWLFNALLDAPRWQVAGCFGRILLVDATHVRSRDKRGGVLRLHCVYDLLAGRLASLQVSDLHTGEGFAHLLVRAGDIVVGDGASSRAKEVLAVAAAQAYALVRYSATHLPLYARSAPAWSREHRVDVVGWLRSLSPGLSERKALVVEAGQELPVRLIAVVLPQEQAQALRRQKLRQARHKGRPLSDKALFLCGFVLLLTTLPETFWSTQRVVELYRARWHIEVFFKRLKAVLDLPRLCAQTAQSAQAMLYALLVGWMLIEEEVEHLRRLMSDGEGLACPLSDWRLARLAFSGLRKLVEGHWNWQKVRERAPELRRLFIERRRRPLREHQRRHRFAPPDPGLGDLVVVFSCSSA
jgi:transposase